MAQVETSDPQKSAQNTALFVHCVSMYAQQAMIAMGKVMNPITQKTDRNLEAAQLFIDMIEMLEAKTKGNLTKDEASMLDQTLSSLRLTYVEEANSKSAKQPASSPEKKASEEPKKVEETQGSTQPPVDPQQAEESKKKFTKKYE